MVNEEEVILDGGNEGVKLLKEWYKKIEIDNSGYEDLSWAVLIIETTIKQILQKLKKPYNNI